MIEQFFYSGFDVIERQPLMDKCGVFAALASCDAALFSLVYPACLALQNRGQDGLGLELRRTPTTARTSQPDSITAKLSTQQTDSSYSLRGVGQIESIMTQKLLEQQQLSDWEWFLLMWQVRYGTSGLAALMNTQPMICQHPAGGEAIIIHNGQFLESAEERAKDMSDTFAFTQRLATARGNTWDERIINGLWNEQGAFSLVIGVPSEKCLYLVRDPRGIRPLCYGLLTLHGVSVWVVASETHALNQIGLTNDHISFVGKGQIIKLRQGIHKPELVADLPLAPEKHCSFEVVYLQRPESMVQTSVDMSVYESRYRAGEQLAELELANEDGLRAADIDLVIGIPSTAVPSGKGFAATLGVEYQQAIWDREENDSRTFMSAEVDSIMQDVLQHYDFDEEALAGKRVLLVDDSLVRGNVSGGLIRLLKQVYHVAEVHVRIVSPMVVKSCRYGVNTRSDKELLAAQHKGDVTAMCRAIGADSLKFLPLADLSENLTGNRDCQGICTACWAGGSDPYSDQLHVVSNQRMLEIV